MFFFPHKIETKLTHVVLNPSQVPHYLTNS